MFYTFRLQSQGKASHSTPPTLPPTRKIAVFETLPLLEVVWGEASWFRQGEPSLAFSLNVYKFRAHRTTVFLMKQLMMCDLFILTNPLIKTTGPRPHYSARVAE